MSSQVSAFGAAAHLGASDFSAKETTWLIRERSLFPGLEGVSLDGARVWLHMFTYEPVYSQNFWAFGGGASATADVTNRPAASSNDNIFTGAAHGANRRNERCRIVTLFN
jgi:hypothetical protein